MELCRHDAVTVDVARLLDHLRNVCLVVKSYTAVMVSVDRVLVVWPTYLIAQDLKLVLGKHGCLLTIVEDLTFW